MKKVNSVDNIQLQRGSDSQPKADTKEIRVFRATDIKNISQIVGIHLLTFEGFFLTFLGRGFLKHLYEGFVQYNRADIYYAQVDKDILGFLAYSEDMSGFYKWLIKKKLVYFAWYSLLAFFRKPRCLFRLLRAFLKPDDSKRDVEYVELASIGVRPDSRGRGIGHKLIDKLKSEFDPNKYSYIALETDTDNNEDVNMFYRNNEFVLVRKYETAEGRRMNEYRWKP